MNKSKNFLKVLVVGIVLCAIVVILTGCGNKKEENNTIQSYEEPIKNMAEGMQNLNLEQYKSAFPDFINYQVTQDNLDELMRVYKEIYGDDMKMSYEIISKEEVSTDKLSEIQENIKTYYNHDCNITKGYKLEITETIKGSHEEEKSNSVVNVYEIDGKWYAINF